MLQFRDEQRLFSPAGKGAYREVDPMTTNGLPELDELERVIELGHHHLRVSSVQVAGMGGGKTLPVHRISLGSGSSAVGVAGFFGGVHGLERIGSQVVIAHLSSLVNRLRWDDSLHALLENVRIVFMPIVNPFGMLRGTRANARGVDLMRNAPVEARGQVPFLIGGQRISAGLPWYRGRAGQPMEIESAALCELVETELHSNPCSLAVDCHSGFGMRDRIWFPFAHRRPPIRDLGQLHALHDIYRQSHMHHRYVFEPQSHQYLTHGDLWDHLYLRACASPERTFLPLTLEMGSWLWIKKNPRQLFSKHGVFNPLIEHRQQRVLRSHLPLLDFVTRAAASWRNWLPQGDAKLQHHQAAISLWYKMKATE